MLAAWALVPLVFLLLAGGAGLGVRRASGDVVPGALVPVCGFAALVLYGWLAAQVAPGAIVPGSVAIALLGACAGLRRAPVPRPGALATGLGAFALFAAPIVLSGEATIAGYIKLDDTATWLAITDRVLDAGPSADGLSISTYEATLAVNLDNGYPYGALVPLGVAGEIAGVDAAWAFQPYVAMLGAMLALALWQLAAPLAARPATRCACAVLASQSALLVGFYLWGGIKEVAMAMVAAGACALAAAFRPGEGAARSLVPLGLLIVATVPLASPGALFWLTPAAAVLALRAFRSRWSWRAVALGTLGMTALLAAVLLSGRHLSLGRGSFTNQDDVGNLGSPLEATQVLGVWPSGDFRFAPDDRAVAVVAAAALATAAVAGVVTLVRRQEWAPAVFPAGVAAVCLAACALGSPWLDAKAMAIASPAILFAALVGIGLVRSTPIRIATLVLAGGLVIWSAVAQWGGASLAPRAQLSELEEIGAEIAGSGPTLMTEYSPYGVRHFLRAADPEAVSELRRREIPTRNGDVVPKGLAADTDSLDPEALGVYRTLVLRRSPAQSRPPAAYRLVWRGEFYEAWQRPETASVPAERLPLGSRFDPVEQPSCADVRALARGADAVVAASGQSPLVVQLRDADYPAAWRVGEDAVLPESAGSVEAEVSVGRPGDYEVWLGGSVRPAVSLWVDGERVGEVRHRLNNSGQYVGFGSVALAPGSHGIEFRFAGADLHPGSGGRGGAIGPVALSRGEAADSRLVRVPASDFRTLCGREWDWIEVR